MFLKEIRLNQNIDRDMDHYPFSIPSLRPDCFPLSTDQPVTFLIGENGSGKSTLMEAVAIERGYNPSGGSQHIQYDYVPTESSLADHIQLSWNKKTREGFFFRAETFFNFASELDVMKEQPTGAPAYDRYGGKSLHQQSHGESFLSLFANGLGSGLFLFDEPEAALSPQRQLSFLSILHERVTSQESQFIIASHSPILLSYPDAVIYQLSPEGIQQVNYQETEHYRITKDFLNNPEAFHRHLF